MLGEEIRGGVLVDWFASSSAGGGFLVLALFMGDASRPGREDATLTRTGRKRRV
jgi:hypothetical protein